MFRSALTLTLFVLLFSCGRNIEETEKNNSQSPIVQEEGKDKKIDEARKEELKNLILGNSPTMLEQALIGNGFVDFHFKDGETPLTLAIKNADNQIIRLIADASQDLNLQNKTGEFPLHLIVTTNNLRVLNTFISKEFNIDKIYEPTGHSALFTAIQSANEEIAKTLLIEGAKTKIKTTKETQIDAKRFAINARLNEIIRLIIEIQNHKKINIDNVSQAVESGNSNLLKYYLTNFEAYKAVFKDNTFFNSCLDLEVEHKDKIIKTLLRFDEFNINLSDKNGLTPILYATKNSQLKTVRKLIANNANPLLKDNEGNNALIYSVHKNNFDFLKIIFNSIERTLIEDQETLEVTKVEACQEINTEKDNPENQDKLKLLNKMYRHLRCSRYQLTDL